MKDLAKFLFYVGKAWVALVLFVAMVISTVVSLPFIAIGKVVDIWNISRLKSGKNHITSF